MQSFVRHLPALFASLLLFLVLGWAPVEAIDKTEQRSQPPTPVIGSDTVSLRPPGLLHTPSLSNYDRYLLAIAPFRHPTGSLKILVWTGQKWEKRALLNLDQFYRQQRVRLDLGSTGEGEVHVRLEKQGGGSLHIDAASLDGQVAALQNRTLDGRSDKLAANDFDVVHVGLTPIDLVFDGPHDNGMLSITARIESENPSKVPFLLPLGNTGRPISAQSQFLEYAWNSRLGTLSDSKNLAAVATEEPFYQAVLEAKSGHPSDTTYTWVFNDEQTLYVVMDVTGDNTRDGDKDYAIVYVKTPIGIKQFKVTESQTRWGQS
ncbi:hypothetical protein D6833_12440, partial [Candidatus Parcubacteria bacterium]